MIFGPFNFNLDDSNIFLINTYSKTVPSEKDSLSKNIRNLSKYKTEKKRSNKLPSTFMERDDETKNPDAFQDRDKLIMPISVEIGGEPKTFIEPNYKFYLGDKHFEKESIPNLRYIKMLFKRHNTRYRESLPIDPFLKIVSEYQKIPSNSEMSMLEINLIFSRYLSSLRSGKQPSIGSQVNLQESEQ